MITFKKKEVKRTYFPVIMQWRYGGFKTSSVFDAINVLNKALDKLINNISDTYFDEIIDKGIVPSVQGTFSQTIFYPYIIIKRNYYEDKYTKYQLIKLKNNKILTINL